MADGGEGFVGCVEVVWRTRGYRRWPDAVKPRIVAESFRPGSRVADIARRHELAPHQVSDWRRQARQGLLADALDGLTCGVLPAFVPVSVDGDAEMPPGAASAPEGVVSIEVGDGVVVRVPGDVSAGRVAVLVRGKRRPRPIYFGLVRWRAECVR